MKRYYFRQMVLLLIFISVFQVASAQNNSLKIYSNFLYAGSSQTPMHFDHDGNAPFLYNHLSFAFRKEQGLRFDEFELRLLFKSEARDNHKVTQFETSIGYEYGKQLQKKLFNTLIVRWGGAGKLYYLNENIESIEYNIFPVENKNVGLWAGAYVHLEYPITDRFYVDVNTCFISATLNTSFVTVENPTIPPSEQQTNGIDFKILQDRILRVGLGFRLGYFGSEDEEDEIQKEWDERKKKKGKGKKKKKKRG